MTQHSEERLPEAEGAPSLRPGARILPFERPQSELQRAIQQRAQEALDIDREREREKRRPQPLKWITIFVLACIPVVLTIGAVDAFVRVFHALLQKYSTETTQQQEAPPAEIQSGSTPGIVMLQPYDSPAEAQKKAQSPDASKSSAPPPADPQPQPPR